MAGPPLAGPQRGPRREGVALRLLLWLHKLAKRSKIGPRFALPRKAIHRREPSIADAPATLELRQERSLQLAMAAARTACDHRGQDIVVLDMRGMTTEFDYFLLVTGNSRRQLHAISEEIDRTLQEELGDQRLGVEGYNESRWILLDYGSVVIHLFDAETRAYYALEDLWGEATRVSLPWNGGRQGEGETRRQGDSLD